MLRISVNGTACNTASGPENWGDLLDRLETGDGGGRRIVTAVRFGGVAVPTFREPIALGRTLDSIATIEVELASLDDLLHTSAQAAFASIAPLTTATTRMVRRLRVDQAPTAARDLPALVASVQTLTTLTVALARARRCHEPHRADFDALVLRLCRLVEDVLAQQRNAEWQAVASLLERDLLPTLDAWVLVARRVWSVARS